MHKNIKQYIITFFSFWMSQLLSASNKIQIMMMQKWRHYTNVQETENRKQLTVTWFIMRHVTVLITQSHSNSCFPNKYLFLYDLVLLLITYNIQLLWLSPETYKAGKESHYWKASIRRGVQKNFQNMRCEMSFAPFYITNNVSIKVKQFIHIISIHFNTFFIKAFRQKPALRSFWC